MKLTPGVDFTSILQASFASADSKSAKKQASHQCLFALFESWHPKVQKQAWS